MLRVSYGDTSEGQQWTLSGRLSGQELEELRSSWQQAHERAPHARRVVDLRDVTFIGESGRNLLAEMYSTGAEFLVAGVENKQLLATLQQNGRRPCKPLSAPSGPLRVLGDSTD